MFDRFKLLPRLWRTGRLALRLLRDPRVPLAAKLVLGATVLYLLSPLDVAPDWLPVVGQADDLLALLAGLNLFLRACPRWLVEEHEDALDGRRRERFGGETPGARPAASATYGGPTRGEVIDGEYTRVR